LPLLSSVEVQLPLSLPVTLPDALAVPLALPPVIVVVPEPGTKKAMALVPVVLSV